MGETELKNYTREDVESAFRCAFALGRHYGSTWSELAESKK